MSIDWTDLQIIVPAQHSETAENVAFGIAQGGIYIEDYRDMEQQVLEIAHIDLIDEELLKKDRDKVIVHMYISSEENLAQILQLVQDRMALQEIPYTINTDGLKQEDWEKGWKAYYHPIEIGKRLAVVPSWEEYNTDRVKITLDPGMAFGTGTHETTALCLKVLDSIIKGGERVLDIGTGSGILAIATLKLGAKSAIGVDIDPMCVRVATENAQINGVEDNFTVKIGDLSKQVSGKYNIICANIVANAIMELSKFIPELLENDGVFIASGIIDTRCDEVVNALKQANLQVKEVIHEGGWVAIICENQLSV